MPLGISHLCVLSDYIQIHTCFDRDVLSPTLLVQKRQRAKSFISFSTGLDAAIDTVNVYKTPIFA